METNELLEKMASAYEELKNKEDYEEIKNEIGSTIAPHMFDVVVEAIEKISEENPKLKDITLGEFTKAWKESKSEIFEETEGE